MAHEISSQDSGVVTGASNSRPKTSADVNIRHQHGDGSGCRNVCAERPAVDGEVAADTRTSNEE
jgi:hypothetical protein